MNTKLVRIYRTYGKSAGEELSDVLAIEDTPEERKALLDDFFHYAEVYASEEDFIKGEVDELFGDISGGDWDEPTGLYLKLTTREEALHDLMMEYERKAERIVKAFSRLEETE